MINDAAVAVGQVRDSRYRVGEPDVDLLGVAISRLNLTPKQYVPSLADGHTCNKIDVPRPTVILV